MTLRLMRTARGWRFVCPGCGRSAMNLYFPPDSLDPRCRVCLDLVYESQYLPLEVAYLRAVCEEMNRKLKRPSA